MFSEKLNQSTEQLNVSSEQLDVLWTAQSVSWTAQLLENGFILHVIWEHTKLRPNITAGKAQK